MASRLDPPPSPLVVRLSQAVQERPGTICRTLEQCFQASGGKECIVRPGDHSAPDSFLVQFTDRAAKERVLEKEKHQILVGAKYVTIFLETTKKSKETMRPRIPSSTLSPAIALPNEQHPNTKFVPKAGNSCVQKVFLTVEANLNCDLFSKEQRAQVTTICPGIKKMEGEDGIEKVCGDFRDIEKIHHFLSMQLIKHEQKQVSSLSILESTPPDMQDSDSNLYTSEPNTISEDKGFKVPLPYFEHFMHTCPDIIDSIRKQFGVNLKTQEIPPSEVYIDFIPGPAGDQDAAQEYFAKEFQKNTESLHQDCISLAGSKWTKEELSDCFTKLLIKEQGEMLTLLGTQHDISAAKQKISENFVKISVKMPFRSWVDEIEVNTLLYKLLEVELRQEIQEIEQKYNCSSTVSVKHQRTFIQFKPMDKQMDLSAHASASFIDAFQNVTCQLVTEDLSLKPLGQGNKHLHWTEFSDDFRKRHPYIHLTLNKDSMTLVGLPKYLTEAKHHIFLETGLTFTEENMYQETPMDIDKNESESKTTSLSFSGSAHSEVSEVSEKDTCVICLDTIRDKPVLPKCKHQFCNACIQKAMTYKPACPLCLTSYGIHKGNQPKGSMTYTTLKEPLPGYEGYGTIEIQYKIESGTQGKEHPRPGYPYSGTQRTAYLPDNKEGREVLDLLRIAFYHKLIFTVGESRVSGASDVVTWNDIHHKTSKRGGPEKYGYPDPMYLSRVKKELKAKGIEKKTPEGKSQSKPSASVL
ncbi:E3 ubiquitin-protein ligase DTX3L-like isoform 1-T1 [Thomomys bottae]